MKIKKILIILVVCLVGVFVSNVSLKAHNNMDNSNQVIPSTDLLIGDIYIPKLFELTYNEYIVSFVEYYQGGLPGVVDYSYNYNGVNYVDNVPFFTENGAQLFTQYASSFRLIAGVRVIDVANNIDYTVNIPLFLSFLRYANDYPILYNELRGFIDYEYIYFSQISTVYPIYVLDNDNRPYEINIEVNFIFTISSDGDFDSDEVELRVINLGINTDEVEFTNLYIDFYIPNVMLAKDFGNIKYNNGVNDGYNEGFSDGSAGEGGVFHNITYFLNTTVGGFLNFEIVPGFSVMTFYAIIIGLILLIIILKMFMGG